MTQRRSKYGNKRTEVDGISFASKREAKRYSELKLLQRAGEIRSLEVQRRFKLYAENQLICTYVADFCYFETKRNWLVVEDSKGCRTREFIIKKKLMKACYGIDVQEV
jgi:hypothetical protein